MLFQDVRYAIRTLRLAGVRILVGLAGAFAITPVIRTILYNVTPTDPVSFGAVAIFLTGVAFLASDIPAQRALTVDPMVALGGTKTPDDTLSSPGAARVALRLAFGGAVHLRVPVALAAGRAQR